MELTAFLFVGTALMTGIWALFHWRGWPLEKLLRYGFLPICALEQLNFYVDLYRRGASVPLPSALLLAADVDVCGMLAVPVLWTLTTRGFRATQFQLTLLLALLGAPHILGIEMFARFIEQARITPSPMSVNPYGTVATFLVVLDECVAWARFMALSAKQEHVAGIEDLYAKFQVDPVHAHVFFVVFIASWYLVAVVLDVPISFKGRWCMRYQSLVSRCIRLLFIVLLWADITPLYLLLCILFCVHAGQAPVKQT